METFMNEYVAQLTRAVNEKPEHYFYPVEDVPLVAAKMRAAILAKSYNKDGYGFKWACKSLGIKWTYTAINEFVANNP